MAVRTLRALGYTADVAADGAEAVRAVRAAAAQGRPYDVVLMDVQMPRMDGHQATREIRATVARGHQPRIVALTANALDGDAQVALEAGMDGYLTKPLDRAALEAELACAGDRRAGDVCAGGAAGGTLLVRGPMKTSETAEA